MRLVEDVEVHHYNSFPSGHTLAAFACYGFFALIVRMPLFKFVFFLIAFLVGYSRIYLSQHFLQDVIAGAALGTLVASLGYYLMEWLNWPHHQSRLSIRKDTKAAQKEN